MTNSHYDYRNVSRILREARTFRVNGQKDGKTYIFQSPFNSRYQDHTTHDLIAMDMIESNANIVTVGIRVHERSHPHANLFVVPISGKNREYHLDTGSGMTCVLEQCDEKKVGLFAKTIAEVVLERAKSGDMMIRTAMDAEAVIHDAQRALIALRKYV